MLWVLALYFSDQDDLQAPGGMWVGIILVITSLTVDTGSAKVLVLRNDGVLILHRILLMSSGPASNPLSNSFKIDQL